MDYFLLLILAGATAFLWRRTDQLERRLRAMEALDVPAPPRPAQGMEVSNREPVPAARRDDPPETHSREAESRVPISGNPVAEVAIAGTAPGKRMTDNLDWVSQRRERLAASFAMPKFDFENIFGRLLPIWVGGITLAVAGFFLVRYSIESGLLTPSVRVLLSFLFGAGLIGGAEIAYRQEHRIGDARVRQALAGAGLATLYAAFYLAGTTYGLIGSAAAFAGLAAVTAGAIGLSYRFGLPSAVLALVGGFAAPALVSSAEPNLPVLAAYLALVTAGISITGKRQDRAWLSLTALGAALGWGWLMLASVPAGVPGIAATGVLILAAGVVLPSLRELTGVQSAFRLVGAAMAAVQIGILVDMSDHGLLAWGLLALLSAALAFFGWNDVRMRQGSVMAAAVTAVMLALWPDADAAQFALVAAVATVIFAGASMAHVWRGQREVADFAILGAVPLALSLTTLYHFAVPSADWPQPLLASIIAGWAAIPAVAAWRVWPDHDGALNRPTLGLVTGSAVTAYLAGLLFVPVWLAPLIPALIAAALFALNPLRADVGLRNLMLVTAFAGLWTLIASASDFQSAEAIIGYAKSDHPLRSAVRFALAAAPWVFAAIAEGRRIPRAVAEMIAVILVYCVLAQFVPFAVLPAVWAAGLIVMAWQLPARMPAVLTGLAIAAAWAVLPLGLWMYAGLAAMGGMPFFVIDAPSLAEVATRIVPLGAAMGSIAWLATAMRPRIRSAFWVGTAALGLIALHSAFKLVFGVDSDAAFIAAGFAERTVWQGLLLAPAIAVLTLRGDTESWNRSGFVSAMTSLTYFLGFSFLLHNPLLQGQATGSLPVLNLLIPAYGLAAASLYVASRLASGRLAVPRAVWDTGMMALITIFALSCLRHVFAGSILTQPDVGQTEDLLRSVLGIVLAIGFLAWGGRTGARSWRIGSLALMLLAISKVFLLDAAGLEGLWRIASFMALGFSLIGIGWFYSRQLLRAGSPPHDNAA